MIFAPIAFASHTIPFKIPGLGWDDWWDELFKNAFLAPIFVFMLYLIVMFAGFLKEIISYPTDAELIQKLMATVIPFIILMVLLMKAKDLAVKYAGEMGGAMVKAGKMVGGVALGATAGVAAFAGRNVIGGVVGKMANSATLARLEAGGGGFGKVGKIVKVQYIAPYGVDLLSGMIQV